MGRGGGGRARRYESEQGLWGGSRQRGAQEPLDKALGCGSVRTHIHGSRQDHSCWLGDYRQE